MTHDNPGVRRVGALLLALGTVACANRSEEISPTECAPFDTVAQLNTDAIANLAGDFTLSLTATSGEHTGVTSVGRLTLRANIDERRGMRDAAGNVMADVVVPYYGMSDIDVTTVGALSLGNASSNDASRPGILVVQRNSPAGAARSVVMRIGADANVRGATRFDGGYTVLRVRYVTPDSVFGEWVSGVMTEIASGYFCAIRR